MPLEVEKTYADPSVHQFSVFLENRVGMLRRFIELLESSDIQIVGISILDTADSAIVRVVFDDADRAREVLQTNGRAYTECELLAATLPTTGLGVILSTLLQAEINLHYVYPLIRPIGEPPVIALHVDERSSAAEALRKKNIQLLDQSDIL